MFDITKIAAADTSVLHLKGPDDEFLYVPGKEGRPDLKKPVQIVLYGPGSKPYADAQSKQQNRSVERLKRKGKFDVSAEEKRAEQAELLASCTVRFENLAYSPAGDATGQELFQALYADPSLGFVTQQVLAHIGDWANFTSASAKS